MSDQQGFTLVELLVALVVGGLLLAALSGVVAGFSRDLRSADAQQPIKQAETIAPALKALLENAVVPDRDSLPAFTDTHAQLTVSPPQALANAGPLRLELDVEKLANGEALLARFRSRDGRALPAFLSTPKILVEGLRHIEISASPSPSAATTSLPALIRIVFEPVFGPPIAISAEPRLSSDGACLFDPISMTCRA